MEGIPLTPSVIRVQDKVEKASMTSILAGALSTNRIHDLSIAETARKKRKESSGGNKVVEKYGEIYGHQARRDIAADDEDESRVVNMREARLAKPWRAKYKSIMRSFTEKYSEVRLNAVENELRGSDTIIASASVKIPVT
jgi:hypothetical protein